MPVNLCPQAGIHLIGGMIKQIIAHEIHDCVKNQNDHKCPGDDLQSCQSMMRQNFIDNYLNKKRCDQAE